MSSKIFNNLKSEDNDL